MIKKIINHAATFSYEGVCVNVLVHQRARSGLCEHLAMIASLICFPASFSASETVCWGGTWSSSSSSFFFFLNLSSVSHPLIRKRCGMVYYFFINVSLYSDTH
jgi:hypothetical protein